VSVGFESAFRDEIVKLTGGNATANDVKVMIQAGPILTIEVTTNVYFVRLDQAYAFANAVDCCAVDRFLQNSNLSIQGKGKVLEVAVYGDIHGKFYLRTTSDDKRNKDTFLDSEPMFWLIVGAALAPILACICIICIHRCMRGNVTEEEHKASMNQDMVLHNDTKVHPEPWDNREVAIVEVPRSETATSGYYLPAPNEPSNLDCRV